MRTVRDRRPRDGAWLLSPAIATAVFFACELLLGADAVVSASGVAGAGPETPVAAPVEVRVVSQIQRADDPRRLKRRVPGTEADLLRLLQQDGTVTFLSDEVEVVATPAKEFSAGEVDVITAERAAGPR